MRCGAAQWKVDGEARLRAASRAPGQVSRHGGGQRSRDQTSEEAQAAVHLAATLVHLLGAGALTRRSTPHDQAPPRRPRRSLRRPVRTLTSCAAVIACAGWLLGYGSPHTRRAYARDLTRWVAWCDQLDVDPLAADRVHTPTAASSRVTEERSRRSARRSAPVNREIPPMTDMTVEQAAAVQRTNAGGLAGNRRVHALRTVEAWLTAGPPRRRRRQRETGRAFP